MAELNFNFNWFSGLSELLDDPTGAELFKKYLEIIGYSTHLQFYYTAQGVKHLNLTDPIRRERFISTLLETYASVVYEFGENNNENQSEQLLNRTADNVLKHLRDVAYPAFLDSQIFDGYLAQLNGDVWAKSIKNEQPKASNKTEYYEREQSKLYIRHVNQKMNESARTNPPEFAKQLGERILTSCFQEKCLIAPNPLHVEKEAMEIDDENNPSDILDSHFTKCSTFESPERKSPEMSCLEKAKKAEESSRIIYSSPPQEMIFPTIAESRASTSSSSSSHCRRGKSSHSSPPPHHHCSKRNKSSRFSYDELRDHLKDLKRHPSIASFDSGFKSDYSRSTGASSSSSSSSRGIRHVEVHITFEDFGKNYELRMFKMPGTFGSGITLKSFQMSLPIAGSFQYFFETRDKTGNRIRVEIVNPCEELPMVNEGKIWALLTNFRDNSTNGHAPVFL